MCVGSSVLLWLLAHPCHNLRVVVHLGGGFTRNLIPRAGVRPRPLQHVQVPFHSGGITRPRVPRAVVLPRPLQHRQVPAASGEVTRKLIPRSAVLPCPLRRSTSPLSAAKSPVTVVLSTRQPFSHVHCITSRRPCTAASAHALINLRPGAYTRPHLGSTKAISVV